jgi:hypothetical protein
MEPITVQMHRGKETSRSWRYETDEDVTPNNIYISKNALRRLGDPLLITVTITPSN